MLREHKQPLSIWCTAAVKEDLSEGNPLFQVLSHYSGVDWHELKADHTASRIPGAASVSFTALPLTSNAPPYSPHRTNR